MTLAELWRWGALPTRWPTLLPAADAAVAWILGRGDPDGDGLVEYGGPTANGVASLANQGWKDSDDAVRQPDGILADGPIAMVEVQGYCHAAFLALAELRDAFGTGDPAPLRRRATLGRAPSTSASGWTTRTATRSRSTAPSNRCGRSPPTPGTSCGPARPRPDSCRRRLAGRLMADDMFTGFGLRTLSAANPGYNPLSYHCGSVWPHDTAWWRRHAANGSPRPDAAWPTALLDAAGPSGRLPELFGGFDVAEFARRCPTRPRARPRRGRPAAPVLLVRALLGLEPDAPAGVVPADLLRLPAGASIELRGVPARRGASRPARPRSRGGRGRAHRTD